MLVNFARKGRVLVVGDVMLDQYVQGSASRLSPEAPVPVLKWARERHVAGGAANVAANIASLGGAVDLASVVGDDRGAKDLDRLLGEHGPHLTALFTVDGSRPTTLKTRFVTANQQLLRVDQEDAGPVAEACETELLAAIARNLARSRVVVLSDYRKGVLSARVVRGVIERCLEADVPVVVDPKVADWTLYKGATIITPNRAELIQATGLPCDTDAEVEAAALRAVEMTGSAILVTRSERGMSLVERGRPAFHMPTQAREVFDVSGAGDTVVAVLAAALASDLDLHQAMRIANVAAGLVVAKHGTATLRIEELNRALRAIEPRHTGVSDTTQAVMLRELWREQGLKVGFTNGCFDILHAGHVQLLEQAAANCDRLIVGINSDHSVQRLKGPTRPVQDELSRAKILSALFCVDAVVMFDEDTPYEIIATLTPDLLVKGADYTEENVVGADIVKAAGGSVLLATLKQGHSTSAIIARSKAGGSARLSEPAE